MNLQWLECQLEVAERTNLGINPESVRELLKQLAAKDAQLKIAREALEVYAYRKQCKVQGEFTGDYDVDVGPLYYSHYEDIDPGTEPATEALKKMGADE